MKLKLTRESKIGLFTALCLFALFWGINFLKGRNIFNKNNTYYAIFQSVDGLKNTNNVLINGFKVGLVKNIEFNDIRSGKFCVTLLIGKKYKIPRNTIAKLISADIMGGKAIKLEISEDTLYFNPGDTLPSAVETGLIDQLGHQMVPVKEKAEEMMVELSKTLRVMQQVFNEANRANLSKSILHLNHSLANIQRLTHSLDTMLGSPNGSLNRSFDNLRSISDNIRKNNREISNTIRNISAISDTLAGADMAQTLRSLQSSLSRLDSILYTINSGKGTLGNLVKNDTLYQNLQGASRSLELLLNDFKTNPRRYVNFSIFDFSRTKYVKEKAKH